MSFLTAPVEGGASPAPGATTPSPSPSGPGSTPGAGSYTPDWTALIQNDAGLKAAQAALAGSAAADKNALASEFANAYESFGKPIDLATLAAQLGMTQADIQDALGPDAQKIAQENTNAGLSTTARLDQANNLATRAIIANLNKRGILHSGEAGYRLDQQNLGYRQAQSDAYSKFLSYLQQYQQGYLTAQQQRASSLAGALNSAADRQYSLNQGSGAASSTPTPSTAPPAPPAPPHAGDVPDAYPGLWPVPSLAAQERGQRGSFQPLY